MDGNPGITRHKRTRSDALGIKPRKPRKDIIDLTGQTFHWLTVMERVPTRQSVRRNAVWLCRCLCGGTVRVEGYKLRTSEVKSRGCYRIKVHIPRIRALLGKNKCSTKPDHSLSPLHSEAISEASAPTLSSVPSPATLVLGDGGAY